ncbi:XRE family transcriptional regulator [Streptomyces sp. NBC_01005]|uniref:XRE family transcriptional regulator n=1 Tax=unclassified Streptomyces TaxID=2593676 RepID=UPI003867211E|nr:XRE family transcriptional regulator [Streptomyces sp. NBC_01005]WTC99898.1 XRE family transcriptional regulator [Streptomyces sp. NBC_01650]
MARVRNEAFVAWMESEGWSAPALAKELEAVVRRLTRRTGPGRELSQITVHKWRSGETSWPQEKYRIALEQVSGLMVAALGFAPPDRRKKPAPVADPVHRRSFLALTTGSAGTAVLGPPAAGVGSGDVLRLRQQLDTLMLLDDSQGGHDTLERAALAGAQEAVALQEKPATQRTRQRLFSLAADYTATAAWSCVDARESARAQPRHERALHLAGLAQDPVATMRVWNSVAILAHQRGAHAESLAAGQAARATAVARRDQLFASLAHARTAHAHLGDHRPARGRAGSRSTAGLSSTPSPRSSTTASATPPPPRPPPTTRSRPCPACSPATGRSPPPGSRSPSSTRATSTRQPPPPPASSPSWAAAPCPDGCGPCSATSTAT